MHNVQCSGGVFIQVCVCSVTARGQCLLRKPLPIPMQVIHLIFELIHLIFELIQISCKSYTWVNNYKCQAQNSPIYFWIIFNACALRKQTVDEQKNLCAWRESGEFCDIWWWIWISSCSVDQTMDIIDVDDGRCERRKGNLSWAILDKKDCKESCRAKHWTASLNWTRSAATLKHCFHKVLARPGHILGLCFCSWQFCHLLNLKLRLILGVGDVHFS